MSERPPQKWQTQVYPEEEGIQGQRRADGMEEHGAPEKKKC